MPTLPILYWKEAFGHHALGKCGGGCPLSIRGLDFIGEFKENSSHGHKWILTTTDYFTKWVEAIPIKTTTDQVVMDSLRTKSLLGSGF